MPMPFPRPMLQKLALACGLAAALGVAHAAPDARLLAAAQDAQPALIADLKAMVEIESGSQNVEGLRRMADWVEARLKAIGFQTERRKAMSGPGADTVVATRRGSGQRKLMLQGHMDTVYPAGVLASQPYRVEDKRIYGPGIADDKGGLAVILHALRILSDAGWKDYDTITVVMNPDEEIGSMGSAELIATLGEQQDVVLSFEPGAGSAVMPGQPLLLGAAGVGSARLEVKGRASHAGAAPELGRNALIELSHRLLQTHEVTKDMPGVKLNWTVASANGPLNQITENAYAVGDVRILQPGAEKALDAALQAKIGSPPLIPDTETRVTVQTGRPAYLAGPKGRALAEKAKDIYRELGRELALIPMTGGGTDAAFAARSGKAAVLESFGLAGFGYHARDEYIEIDSIVPRLYLVTRLLMDVSK